MEIERIGEGSLRLTLKKSSIIYNPTDKTTTSHKKSLAEASAVIFSGPGRDGEFDEAKLVIVSPGEYEVEDISIHGIAAAGGEEKTLNVFRVAHDITSVVFMPALPSASLNDTLLESIGVVDVLVLSIAAYNGELKPVEAAKIVRLLEPRVVIPIGYVKRTDDIDKFLSEIGGVAQQAGNFKVKTMPPAGEALQAVLLDIVAS